MPAPHLPARLPLRCPLRAFDTTPFFGAVLTGFTKTVSLEPETRTATPRTARVFLTVRPGDTLASIAARFGTTPRAVKLENDMTKDALMPGVTLKVRFELGGITASSRASRLPPGASWHTVRPSETLSEIYSDYGVTQLELVNANLALRSLDQIRPGQRLIIPGRMSGTYVQLKTGDDLLSVAANYGDCRVSATCRETRPPAEFHRVNARAARSRWRSNSASPKAGFPQRENP
ncbi:MAG: LysM peptidoglycan-binding domain-containing protein, partial [Pleurocapsa sp. SU_196_0]|nr:LysM peptidoglycan-binding domain-containing protein [Pleurocapsa sp. SU_196_0]